MQHNALQVSIQHSTHTRRCLISLRLSETSTPTEMLSNLSVAVSPNNTYRPVTTVRGACLSQAIGGRTVTVREHRSSLTAKRLTQHNFRAGKATSPDPPRLENSLKPELPTNFHLPSKPCLVALLPPQPILASPIPTRSPRVHRGHSTGTSCTE